MRYFLVLLAFVFVVLFPFPSYAQSLSPILRNTPSGIPGSQQYPLYEIQPGIVAERKNIPAGYSSESEPVKACVYGVAQKTIESSNSFDSYVGNLIPAYLSPQSYSLRPSSPGSSFLYIDVDSSNYYSANDYSYYYSCEVFYYPLVSSDSDAFGKNECDKFSKLNSSFLSKFLSFLPQVPESMRLPVILSGITGNNNFLSFLVVEIWNQVLPILLIYLGIKAYKLLPFV